MPSITARHTFISHIASHITFSAFFKRLSTFAWLLAASSALLLPAANAKDAKPKVPYASVAVVPAVDMPLAFESSISLFVPFIARQIMNGTNAGVGAANAKILNDKLTAEGYDKSKLLTELVVKQLQDAGLTVEVLDKIERDPKAPDDVDYTKLTHNSDVIVHVYFNEMTYQSPRGQSAFWPRVSAKLQMYDKSGNNYMYQSDAYLDRGAKESRSGYFDAKDDVKFESQDDMLADPAKVRATLEKITTQAAQYLGKNILEQSR